MKQGHHDGRSGNKIPSSKDHGMPLEELQNHYADTSNHEMGQKKAINSQSKMAASRIVGLH